MDIQFFYTYIKFNTGATNLCNLNYFYQAYKKILRYRAEGHARVVLIGDQVILAGWQIFNFFFQ